MLSSGTERFFYWCNTSFVVLFALLGLVCLFYAEDPVWWSVALWMAALFA